MKEGIKMVTCPKCGTQANEGQTYCTNCNTKLPTQTVKGANFCHKCGAKVVDGNKFCSHCGAKIETVSVPNNQNQQVDSKSQNSAPNVQPTAKPNGKKVNVQNAKCVGKKWFIKFAYKTYETDAEFFDDFMKLSQGTGFSKVNYKVPVQINYSAIYGVETKNKFSIPNIIFAVVVALLALIMQVWVALLISLVVIFIGKTAVVSINHAGGVYTVPTEFMSEADELKNKINMAISQSRS